MGKTFATQHNMEDKADLFERAALLAQDPKAFDSMDFLTGDEKESLRRETTHRWSHTSTLYWLVTACSMAAAVQGTIGIFLLYLSDTRSSILRNMVFARHGRNGH